MCVPRLDAPSSTALILSSTCIQNEKFPPRSAVVNINGGTFWKIDDGDWVCYERRERNSGDFPPGSRGVVDGEIRYVRGREDWLLIRGLGAPHPHANHPEQVRTGTNFDTTRVHHSPGDSGYSGWNAPSLSGSPCQCLINKSFHLAQ